MLRNPKGEMPFLDHLEELRWRIFKGGSALILAAIVGFVVVHYLKVTNILIRPALPFLPEGKLAVFDPLTPFFFELKLAIILGILIAFPIILYQLWSFLSPALERREKRIIIPALYMGLLLFAFGVSLAYFIALPITLKFLYGFQTDTATWPVCERLLPHARAVAEHARRLGMEPEALGQLLNGLGLYLMIRAKFAEPKHALTRSVCIGESTDRKSVV